LESGVTELFSNGVPLEEITDTHLGVWIEGASKRNPIEFSVAIVELAMFYGMEIEVDQWHADRPKFMSGDYDFEMMEDLGFVTDVSLEYLNEKLPANYFFDFDDGLCLFREDAPE
jgi:hypothetical protein